MSREHSEPSCHLELLLAISFCWILNPTERSWSCLMWTVGVALASTSSRFHRKVIGHSRSSIPDRSYALSHVRM